MNEEQRATVATLHFNYNWAPRMIATHVRQPLDAVLMELHELRVAAAAREHAAYLRSLPPERKTILRGIPLGFSKQHIDRIAS